MAQNKALTLQRLQFLIGDSIRQTPELQGVWVTAELSDVRIAGGHCYMELLEKDERGATVAKMRAMIWSNTLMALRRKFYSSTGKDIATGLKVMVRGSANHHAVYGLSFTISDIDPSYTVGDMERLRREILMRLEAEGILENNRSLEFPYLPQKIAVISAPGAAGYGDFMNQLQNNPEGFKFYSMLFPAVMQGERTSAAVREALTLVEATIDFWDCVVIIRGGGATTDLNGFDDYDLAKAIAIFPLPVMVGIGHERDRTVLDEIACVRCKTPTAAAALLVDYLRQAYTAVYDNVCKIGRYSAEALRGEKYRIANLETAIPAQVKTRLLKADKRLSDTGHALERLLSRRTLSEKERQKMLRFRFEKICGSITEKPLLRLKNLENMIRLLSPQNTLKRGYSITLINGKAVRGIKAINPGDMITTRLADGILKSEITEKEESTEN